MYKKYTRKLEIPSRHIPGKYCLSRLSTAILIMTMLHLSASIHAQTVTISKKDITFAQLFKTIKGQTGYNVVWFEKNLKAEKSISVNFKNATIQEVLDKCLSDTGLDYSINNKTILIKKAAPSFRKTDNGAPAVIDIRGRVVDEEDKPLSGATVKVKGTNLGTSTNTNGEFVLNNVNDAAVLSISFIGFRNKEITASQNIRVIKLVPTGGLQEVEINAGYYTVRDRERTGSISKITTESISKQPVNNILEAMIGRMPGVQIEQSSGVPGGGFRIEIRGRNSLRGDGRQPLYLVDNVPYPSSRLISTSAGAQGSLGPDPTPLNYLSPADIESIEVLKDADATAIYGSRGANGVILIKTKKAKSGKTSLDVNYQQGVSKVSSKLNLLNTEQYVEMRKEAFANDGVLPTATDYDINGTWNQQRHTDWQEVLIGGVGQNNNLQASLNGGNEFTQISVRGNYSKQTTVFPGDFSDQKGSGAFTMSHNSTDRKFKIDLSTTYSIDNNNLPQFDLTQFITLAPNAPALYDENGNLNWELNSSGSATWTNPLASTRNKYNGKSNGLISSSTLSYEILPSLLFKSNLGYSNIKFRENLLSSTTSRSPSLTPMASNIISYNFIETWIIEPQITYKRNILNGTLDLLLGSTFQKDDQRSETLAGIGYTSDFLVENITVAPTRSAGSSSSQYKYNALFGRLNYNYNGKYLVNLTGRRDGSSRFGPGKQFANFGALGMAWVFSSEEKLKNIIPALTYGKLRGSFGITGNDQIENYGYLETYSASNAYLDGSGLIPTRLANPDYSWEVNKKLELALDLGFINEKILLTTSWYRNRSSSQLVGYNLPDIAGFTSVQYNLPATVQNTGWEFEVNTINIDAKLVKWKTAINVSIPTNKLLAYPNLAGSSYASQYTVGRSLQTPIGYHYLGVNTQTGLHTFEDLDGNGNDLDALDKRVAPKSLSTHLYGGLTNSFSYKGFNLDVFFQFVSKTARNPLSYYLTPGVFNKNNSVKVMERWRNSGDETEVQKFSQSTVSGGPVQRFGNLDVGDLFADASFIRCKNVALSWQAPESLTRYIKLRNLRLFVQGQNLFTITKFKIDPEVLSVTVLPTLTTVTAGLQIGI